MKKILFIIDSLQIGGVENILITLLNNIDYTNFSLDLLIVYGQYDREKLLNNVTIKHLHKTNYTKSPFVPIRYLYGLMREIIPKWIIRKYLQLDQYDVVIDYKGLNGNILRATKSRKVLWSHGDKSLNTNPMEAEYVLRNGSKISEKIKNWSYKKTLSSCDGIVCISETMKAHFEERFGYSDKTVALYNPIDIDRIRELAQCNKCLKTHGSNKFTFCCVSRITAGKGIERLIEVSDKLQKEGFEFELLIVGGGDKYYEIKENFTKDKKWINLIGAKKNPFQYICNCDAFVCPSETEAWPTIIIEAIALDMPIICTDVGSVKEMLGNSEYGLIVENNSSGIYKGMRNFLTSPSELEKYRAAAHDRSKFFNLADNINKIENYLKGKY